MLPMCVLHDLWLTLPIDDLKTFSMTNKTNKLILNKPAFQTQWVQTNGNGWLTRIFNAYQDQITCFNDFYEFCIYSDSLISYPLDHPDSFSDWIHDRKLQFEIYNHLRDIPSSSVPPVMKFWFLMDLDDMNKVLTDEDIASYDTPGRNCQIALGGTGIYILWIHEDEVRNLMESTSCALIVNRIFMWLKLVKQPTIVYTDDDFSGKDTIEKWFVAARRPNSMQITWMSSA